MKANLMILTSSLLNFDNIETYYTSLGELLLTRQLAIDKGDNVYKPGQWDNIVLNMIIENLDQNEKKFTPQIIQTLRILFNQKSIALGSNPDNIEELNNILNDRPNGLLGMLFEKEDHHCIRDRDDWYSFHRFELVENPPIIEEFCNCLSPYFENLYFNNPSVTFYLHTLHCGSHIPMMKTIMHHLVALENKFYSLFNMDRAEGLPKVCIKFQAEMDGKPISFGCSTDNDEIDSLQIEFKDELTNLTKSLYCDPHTKIWDYLENNFHGDHGDRIYFHQPIDDFIEKKILIGRIGQHN